MNRKVAFFDIDGTLTSEIDGSIPESAKTAISQAREQGHLMFINTGRCMQNVESRFQEIGFDGFVCGCGTNIYCRNENGNLEEIIHKFQPRPVVETILNHGRNFKLDLLFESKTDVRFDLSKPLLSKGAQKQYQEFLNRNYDMTHSPEDSNFLCDKFVVWFQNISDISEFRKVSDLYFDCIDRGGDFREFVPHGYSKATGIQMVLDYYNLSLDSAYAFGDSNNDLSMLSYVKNSIAMGNAIPTSLFDCVSYVTLKASEHGIEHALKELHFI